MQLNVPSDIETLINRRLSSGGYTSVEDVLRRALEAQEAEERWLIHDAVARSIANAPFEEEDINSATAAELDDAHASIARGAGIPHEEIMREFGLMPRG